MNLDSLKKKISDLESAIKTIGTPSVLKTCRFGYDGKGQIRLTDDKNPGEIFSQFKNQPCILEGLINFDLEISVIGARDQYGAVSCYDPGENIHKNGILKTTTVPAKISKKIATDAIILAGKILNTLDYVGNIMSLHLKVLWRLWVHQRQVKWFLMPSSQVNGRHRLPQQ